MTAEEYKEALTAEVYSWGGDELMSRLTNAQLEQLVLGEPKDKGLRAAAVKACRNLSELRANIEATELTGLE